MESSFFLNLRKIFRQHWRGFLKAFLMLLISNILLVSNPLLFRHAVMASSALEGKDSYLHHLPGTTALSWAVLLITVALISAYFKYWMRIGFIEISRQVEKDTREKLFTSIQSQSRSFFDRHGIGELLSRLTNDISLYRDLLGPGIMYPLFFLTIVIPAIIALFIISPQLASLSLIPLVLIPLIHSFIRHKSYQLSHEVQTALGNMSNKIQEHFSGIRIIKNYAIEQTMYAQFKGLCKHFSLLNFKMTTLQGVFAPLFTMLTKITTVFLVLFSGYIILEAWGTLTLGDFVSFMWLQSYIFFPILMLGWILPIYERGRAAYARLVEIFTEPIEVKDNINSNKKFPEKADILFKNLSFTYPGNENPVLNNLNLYISGGSFVGLTGPIGSGKSTLFHLLNREYEIPRDMIFIGGNEIHEYPLSAFRAEMVTVEQSSFLFSRTVAENVRFGREGATQSELEIVTKYADLHETIMEFPEKYETVIGERGVTLSGGQKQRMAIARAFLVNRSILLLDDIFSAVDSETEKRILSAIIKHFSGRTIILITHRTSILEQLDRVIYMVNGKVEEDGAPAELVSKKGHFAALVELQRMDQSHGG